MKTVIRVTASCVFLAAFAATATAQAPYGPGMSPNGPGYSPWLNLLRSGNSAGANYYGLVRPEMEFRNSFRALQQQVGANQLNSSQTTDPRGLPVTGHAAVFLNTGGYFLSSGGGGGANTSFGVNSRRSGMAGTPTLGAGQPATRGAVPAR
jgi:hypothetical protein